MELSMFTSPVLSEDIRILERYMSSKSTSVEGTGSSGNPMVFLKVPRRREGLSMAENPGKHQREIVMQILQPYADELVRLYAEYSLSLSRSTAKDPSGISRIFIQRSLYSTNTYSWSCIKPAASYHQY
jgi:hypothetical protein